MSDLTPEVLDELERLERECRESWDAASNDRYRLRSDLSVELLTHARDLVEAARERDRLSKEVVRLRLKESGGGWRFFAPAFELQGCWVVRGGNGGLLFHVTNKGVSVAVWCSQDDASHQKLTAAEACARLADWPEGQAMFREITGYDPPTCKECLPVQPKESVRCYRSNSGGVWVYGVQHNKYFPPYGDWNTAQPEQTTIKNGTHCTIAEARALLAGRPKSLAEFDRIAGRDEDREHLARLLAIPCKEMRI